MKDGVDYSKARFSVWLAFLVSIVSFIFPSSDTVKSCSDEQARITQTQHRLKWQTATFCSTKARYHNLTRPKLNSRQVQRVTAKSFCLLSLCMLPRTRSSVLQEKRSALYTKLHIQNMLRDPLAQWQRACCCCMLPHWTSLPHPFSR